MLSSYLKVELCARAILKWINDIAEWEQHNAASISNDIIELFFTMQGSGSGLSEEEKKRILPYINKSLKLMDESALWLRSLEFIFSLFLLIIQRQICI